MRSVRMTLLVTVMAGVAMTATACPPMPPAVPTLPATVGVQWVRDAGGVNDPFGGYTPALDRYSVLDGVVSGPTRLSSSLELAPPPRSFLLPGGPGILNGAATFPWNGFAGEGIVGSTVPGTLTRRITFPGGSCDFGTIPGPSLGAAHPSPDGTKVAFVWAEEAWYESRPAWVSIRALTPGCPEISSIRYPGIGSDERVSGGMVVWSPDSSAVLFGLAGPADAGRIMRLTATPGATPVTVIDEPAVNLVPMGWSTTNRLLFARSPFAWSESIATEIVTSDAVGRAQRVIDSATLPSTVAAYHYGYFVPGTTLVVFNDASTTVTSPGGTTAQQFHVRIQDDATGGDTALLGTPPPAVWHTENGVDVPNLEIFDRFVR